MSDRLKAEEDLRIIRSLMERATIYRAISAPTALVAGLLSALAAGAIFLNNETGLNLGFPIASREFAWVWLVVLAISLTVNAFFIRREALRTGRPFISPAMKLAVRAIAPCLLIPLAVTVWFFQTGYLGNQELFLVTVWTGFYGLALLSTNLFAPRSLALLGWAFLLTSMAIPVLDRAIETDFAADMPDLAMGATFGLYHLIYAAWTWSGKAAIADEQSATE
jgi:magnesium-transporting ATPase (P-type)